MTNAVRETVRYVFNPNSLTDQHWGPQFLVSTTRDAPIDAAEFVSDYRFHKGMLADSSPLDHSLRAAWYLQGSQTVDVRPAQNSAQGITALAESHYGRIKEQLTALVEAQPQDQVVEEGAARSALALVNHLRKNSLAPPELSWHGGDAVVMLWALGDTTYAITITEGELGYVVRRNRKPVRSADSIKIDAFRLEDLR